MKLFVTWYHKKDSVDILFSLIILEGFTALHPAHEAIAFHCGIQNTSRNISTSWMVPFTATAITLDILNIVSPVVNICNRLEQPCLTLKQEQVALFFCCWKLLSFSASRSKQVDYAWLSGHIRSCYHGIKWLQRLLQIVHSHLSPAAFELRHYWSSLFFPLCRGSNIPHACRTALMLGFPNRLS